MMDFSTENKENFKENKIDKITRYRASTHIGLHDDKLNNLTEFREAYQAKYGRRAVTTGHVTRETWPLESQQACNILIINRIMSNNTI